MEYARAVNSAERHNWVWKLDSLSDDIQYFTYYCLITANIALAYFYFDFDDQTKQDTREQLPNLNTSFHSNGINTWQCLSYAGGMLLGLGYCRLAIN